MRVERFLAATAARLPDKVALVTGDRRTTYAELDGLANRMAGAALGLGVRRGDRVVIFLESGLDAVTAVYGTLRMGGVFSMVNAQTKAPKLRFILGDLQPALVVTQRRLLPVLLEAMQGGPAGFAVALTDERQDGPAAVGLPPLLDAASPAPPGAFPGIDLDLAYVVYTSGSTGTPKGVMMTHQSSVAGAGMIMEYLENTEDDVILSVIPLSFDYGLYQVLMSVRFGGTVVLEKSFAFPRSVLAKLATERVTGFPMVPTTASLVLQAREAVPPGLTGLRYITNTAAPLPPAHSARLRELFPGARIYSAYGLTENIRGTYLAPEELDRRPTSVGKPVPNSEAWIVNESNERVGPGVIGELVIRGPHILKGYWRNPEATAQMLRPGPHPWEPVMYTGDLFRSDAEGFLYFEGRKDDILKSRGEKVSPKEIENVLYALEGIAEAAVVGVPDPVVGTAIVAVVVRSEGSELTAKQIQHHCAKLLEDFMVPSTIEFRTELPKTESGKIKRREVQAELSDRGPLLALSASDRERTNS